MPRATYGILPQDFKDWAYNLKGEEREAVQQLLSVYLMKEKFFYTLPDGSKVRGWRGDLRCGLLLARSHARPGSALPEPVLDCTYRVLQRVAHRLHRPYFTFRMAPGVDVGPAAVRGEQP